jgi:hypothetical protein
MLETRLKPHFQGRRQVFRTGDPKSFHLFPPNLKTPTPAKVSRFARISWVDWSGLWGSDPWHPGQRRTPLHARFVTARHSFACQIHYQKLLSARKHF